MSTNATFTPIKAASGPNDVYERKGIRAPGAASRVQASTLNQTILLIDGDERRVRLDIQNEDGTDDIYVTTVGDTTGDGTIDNTDPLTMRRIAPGGELIVTSLPTGMDVAVQAAWYLHSASGTPSARVTSYIS